MIDENKTHWIMQDLFDSKERKRTGVQWILHITMEDLQKIYDGPHGNEFREALKSITSAIQYVDKENPPSFR